MTPDNHYPIQGSLPPFPPRPPSWAACEFEIDHNRDDAGCGGVSVLCGAPATHSVDIGGGCTYLCRAHKDECLLSGDHNPDTEYHAIMEDGNDGK